MNERKYYIKNHHPYFIAIKNADIPSILNHLKKGIDIHSRSEYECDIFIEAIKNSDYEAMRFALKHGYSIDHPYGITGQRPLMRAVASNDVQLINFCIENGANLNATDDIGYTAYHRAILGGNIEIAKKLISAGADPDYAPRAAGAFDFVCACESSKNTIETIEFVWQRHNKKIPQDRIDKQFVRAVKRSEYEACHWLLEHGANVHSKDEYKKKPAVEWAHEKKDQRIIELVEKHIGISSC